jgi:hypothetical protein
MIGQPSPCHPAPAGRAPLAAGPPVLRRQLWRAASRSRRRPTSRRCFGVRSAPASVNKRARAPRHQTCPVSTEGGTRRVQLVREGVGGWGGGCTRVCRHLCVFRGRLSINASCPLSTSVHLVRELSQDARKSGEIKTASVTDIFAALDINLTAHACPAPRAPSQRPAARANRLKPGAGRPRGREKQRFVPWPQPATRTRHAARPPPAR